MSIGTLLCPCKAKNLVLDLLLRHQIEHETPCSEFVGQVCLRLPVQTYGELSMMRWRILLNCVELAEYDKIPLASERRKRATIC